MAATGNTSILFNGMTCAAIGNDLHVVVTDLTIGMIWHTIRFANSSQPWGSVTHTAGMAFF